MHAYSLAHVADEMLLADLAALAATDRRTTAALLAHLAEVEARGLFLPAACSSMHAYCTKVLHLAEEVAYKRIRAARIARRYPQIFGAIAEGRLHVSGVVLLAPHLTDENVDHVLAAAAHRSRIEIEILVARLAPQPDLPTAMNPITPPSEPKQALQLDPDPVPPQRPVAAPPRAKPLSPERFGLQLTVSQTTRDKLERATALLRHRNPSGDLAEVIDRALDALLDKLEKEKFGATARPRATKARSDDADLRYVPNEVRRTVHARDGEQCSFVSAKGIRCTERGFLELDHETPVCLGGEPTADTIRLLCRAHNQYEAERKLGADLMRAKRTAAKQSRAARANKRLTDAQPIDATSSGAAVDTSHGTNVTTPIAVAPAQFDSDVASALRNMGFKAEETRCAMLASAQEPATTFEQRIRTALAALTRMRASRCSDGWFNLAGGRAETWIACG